MDHTSLIKEVDIPELVKALRNCQTDSSCGLCPRNERNLCFDGLHDDAAAAIEALMDAEKTYLAELAQCHENLRRAAETRRERDERIEALQTEVRKYHDAFGRLSKTAVELEQRIVELKAAMPPKEEE